MLSFLGKPEDSMQNNNKIDHLQNFIFDTNVILFKKANKKINKLICSNNKQQNQIRSSPSVCP